MILYFEKVGILLLYFGKIFSSIDYPILFRKFRNISMRILTTYDFITGKLEAQAPNFVAIEPTNICNLKCIMCPNSEQTRKKGFLSFENFKKIADSLDRAVENINLSFMGETLLNENLIKMILYAKSRGFGVTLSTNISFLTNEKASELANSGLDVLILSLDSEKPETYESIRRGSDFKKVVAKIKDFLKINNNRVFTIIQKIHIQENKSSTWDYVKEMNSLGANLVRLKPYRDLSVKRSHLRVDNYSDNKISKIKCPYLWKISVYTWEGDMIPCGVDYDAKIKIGSAYQFTQNELWNSEALKNMREQHVLGNKETLDLCRGCSAIDFNMASMVLSSLVDSTNQVKLISVIQTIKILLKNFKSS